MGAFLNRSLVSSLSDSLEVGAELCRDKRSRLSGRTPEERERKTTYVSFLLCCNCHCRGLDNKAWGGQTEGRKGSPTHQSSTLLYFSTNIFAIKIVQTVTEVPRKIERTNRLSSGPLVQYWVQYVQCVLERFFI